MRVGRLELDVIAEKPGLAIVCEVRARRAGGLVHPTESIDARKIARVRQATAALMRDGTISASAVRLDVASVLAQPDGELEIEIFENAI